MDTFRVITEVVVGSVIFTVFPVLNTNCHVLTTCNPNFSKQSVLMVSHILLSSLCGWGKPKHRKAESFIQSLPTRKWQNWTMILASGFLTLGWLNHAETFSLYIITRKGRFSVWQAMAPRFSQQHNWWVWEKNLLVGLILCTLSFEKKIFLLPPNITERQTDRTTDRPRTAQRPGCREGVRRPDYWVHPAVSPWLNQAWANGISSLICLKGNFSAVTWSQILLFCSSALKDIYNLFVIYWNLPGCRGTVSCKLQFSQPSPASSFSLWRCLPTRWSHEHSRSSLKFIKWHVMLHRLYYHLFIKTLRGYNRWRGRTKKGRKPCICGPLLDTFAVLDTVAEARALEI